MATATITTIRYSAKFSSATTHDRVEYFQVASWDILAKTLQIGRCKRTKCVSNRWWGWHDSLSIPPEQVFYHLPCVRLFGLCYM